jgi:hypothetical protein
MNTVWQYKEWKEIEQPSLVKAEKSKRQQWFQQTLNSVLSGDPFLAFDPKTKILCGTVLGISNIPLLQLIPEVQPEVAQE